LKSLYDTTLKVHNATQALKQGTYNKAIVSKLHIDISYISNISLLQI